MANDRLYLECPCGDVICIYKYYPCGMGYARLTQDELDEWMTKHIVECVKTDMSFEGKPPFALRVESDENWQMGHR